MIRLMMNDAEMGLKCKLMSQKDFFTKLELVECTPHQLGKEQHRTRSWL